jgi:hypothetical protein
MDLFDANNIPTTTSWIKSLSSSQAIQQCVVWSIEPAKTLEENRVLLKNFVTSNQDRQHGDNTQPTNSQNIQTETPLAPDEQKTMNQHTDQPQTTPPLLDPNIKFLVESMQQLTVNAMTETARMIAKEMQGGLSTRPPDETTIPPYVRDMIKNISPLNSNDHDQIFSFLKKVHKLIKLKLTSERAILLNLGALVQNSLHEYWMDKVANHISGEDLINGILQTFLTPDVLRQLQNKYLYRPQKEHEGLADYVNDVQCNFKILSPQTPEKEIFNIIFRGINPQTRTTFAGLPPVTSIKDLIELAPLSASLVAPPISSRNSDNTTRPHSQPAFSNRYYTPPSPSGNYQNRPFHYPQSNNRQQNNYSSNQSRNFTPNNYQRHTFPSNQAHPNRGQSYHNFRYQGPSQANTYNNNQPRFPQSNSRRGAR